MSTTHTITTWNQHTRYHVSPIKIFHQLCSNKINTLLLESSEIDNKKPCNSTLIVDSALRITAYKNRVTLVALSKNGEYLLAQLDAIIPSTVRMQATESCRNIWFPLSLSSAEESERLLQASIFDCFRWLIRVVQEASGSLSSLFFAGLLSYDLIHSFENIPSSITEIICPDLCFYLAESMITMDHSAHTAILHTHVFTDNILERSRLYTRLHQLDRILRTHRHLPSIPSAPHKQIDVSSSMSDVEYAAIMHKMHTFIAQGEIFQVVPSRPFYCPCTHPLAAYNILKSDNPSPYMFFMQDTAFTLFGASPESYLKYSADNRMVTLHPIAGTRPRGRDRQGHIDRDLDNRIELSLRTDQKELSEHIMLVDVARNDLAKVCRANSRYVSRLMKVEKYSHVMHLVSHVTGILQNHLDIFHAYQSCMNMGTLTGAPKLRAMQLIAQYESVRRGAYGGSIGYFTGSGSFDTCIVIRSAFIQKNIATIQSGAGIIYDSIMDEEVQESKNKAQAVLQSIFKTHHVDTGKYYV
ncbi:Anthranilate synthase component 1 (plasmid) [Buchnera aphidicola (Cinara cuneomaculata)]|uniref:Anthranilate synthase component 1 n=1 Tax=Buchnera aphidicola (Cinara cuneomaculata) TaxID=1660040 RepID=A0A451D528_9GAMM|nr:anthranilate synthase component 1 [Buchnera aphidicola]VFP80783.1 Anthranilate synthase component 1 [Buchnera aphidicola (Cinara cuneomaculata)]VFP80785.1 Anthranilate synthase component 1 [Buchnera aphidicola (Cinara cuneomaculata)]